MLMLGHNDSITCNDGVLKRENSGSGRRRREVGTLGHCSLAHRQKILPQSHDIEHKHRWIVTSLTYCFSSVTKSGKSLGLCRVRDAFLSLSRTRRSARAGCQWNHDLNKVNWKSFYNVTQNYCRWRINLYMRAFFM